MKAIMCCGGELSDRKLFYKYYFQCDYAIALDSGIRYFYTYGVVCNKAMGDFDSIDIPGREYIQQHKIEVEKVPCEKDFTDFEMGIRHLIKKFDTIYVFGATGNRIDQMLSSLHFIKDYKNQIIFIDDNNRIQYLHGFLEIEPDYRYVSIIPMSEDGIVISLHGFYYPLDREKIPFSSTRCTGNYLAEKTGKIVLHKGRALVIESN